MQILQRLWSGISSWVGSLFSKVSSFAKQLPGKIKSGIGSLVSVGADWVRGLWNGIGSKVDWILGKIKGFGKSVLNGLKSIFGICSPSKETAKIGGWLADGLDVGFQREMKKIDRKISATAGNVLGTIDNAARVAATPAPAAIDYERLTSGAQAIYIDGRLIGRALRGPLTEQGVTFT